MTWINKVETFGIYWNFWTFTAYKHPATDSNSSILYTWFKFFPLPKGPEDASSHINLKYLSFICLISYNNPIINIPKFCGEENRHFSQFDLIHILRFDEKSRNRFLVISASFVFFYAESQLRLARANNKNTNDTNTMTGHRSIWYLLPTVLLLSLCYRWLCAYVYTRIARSRGLSSSLSSSSLTGSPRC